MSTMHADTAEPRNLVAKKREVLADELSRRTARRAAVADALEVAAWSSGAIAAALALASGVLSEVTDLGSALTAAGILTGLIATDLVLVMLVLAARIPLLDRAVGHDRAIALHGRLGKPALYLLLAHAVFLTVGYAVADGTDVVSETLLLFSITDMPLAYLGLGLLISVVVTSVIAVRRHLPRELWHGVHLLSYAAVLAALPHELSLGGILMEGTWQRVYWISLTVIAFGSIVVFRVAVPLVRSLRHRLVVDRIEWIAHDVASIWLRGQNVSRLAAHGGQFFTWRFWTGRTWWHAHPISLSAAPAGDRLRITVRVLGAGTRRLTAVPIGTRVSFAGPYGLFRDAARTTPLLAIAAAGIGITPARALLEGASTTPGDATVLLRASTRDGLYLLDEVVDLATERGAAVYTSVGSRDPNGWLAARDVARGVSIRSIFPDLLESDLFICGPDAWSEAVERDALTAGMPARRIHVERFAS